MGMGLALLGGALQGVGQGLTAKATYDLDMRRQQALEQMRRESEIVRQTHQAQLNDQNAARDDARKHYYGSREEARKHGYRMTEAGVEIEGRVTLEGVKAKNDRALQDLKHRYSLSEIEAKSAAELINARTLNKEEVGHVDVARDGALILFNKAGDRIGQSPPGEFNPTRQPTPRDSDDLDTGEVIRLLTDMTEQWKENGRKGPKPTLLDAKRALAPVQEETLPPPPVRSASDPGTASPGSASRLDPAASGATPRARALAELGTVYINATPQSYPGLFRNGRKISLEEARQLVLRAYPE